MNPPVIHDDHASWRIESHRYAMVGIEYGSSSAEQLGDSGDHGGSRGGTGGANSGAGADEQLRL